MAFAIRGSTDPQKIYFAPDYVGAFGRKKFTYVTTDTIATVALDEYIDASDSDDADEAIKTLKIGDVVEVIVVGSVDDTREITGDIEYGGVVDRGELMVLENDGSTINFSDDLQPQTVSYTS